MATEALAALAHETRLQIFRFLVQQGPDGQAVGRIAAEFDLPAATLSFHLKNLKQAGLLKVTREGRSLRYAPNFDCMNALMRYLIEDCCQGQYAPDGCKDGGKDS